MVELLRGSYAMLLCYTPLDLSGCESNRSCIPQRALHWSSSRPSAPAPVNRPHLPTHETYKPLNPLAPPFDPIARRLDM